MSDQFVDAAKERMGAIERLLKGLPGIKGYTDKELRRDADKQVRTLLAQELEAEKQELLAVQRMLLEGGGLLWLDNIDQLTLGNNVVISQGAMIIQGSHNYKKIDYPTLHRPVTLEDGSWVGAGAIVMLGVTLRSHAVLSAGSVATKDLEPYTIYQGNPAQPVRERVLE